MTGGLNGKYKTEDEVWSKEDHHVRNWDLECPECQRTATYMAAAYGALVCPYCGTEFA